MLAIIKSPIIGSTDSNIPLINRQWRNIAISEGYSVEALNCVSFPSAYADNYLFIKKALEEGYTVESIDCL
jgi:hypothetical protein